MQDVDILERMKLTPVALNHFQAKVKINKMLKDKNNQLAGYNEHANDRGIEDYGWLWIYAAEDFFFWGLPLSISIYLFYLFMDQVVFRRILRNCRMKVVGLLGRVFS